MSWSLQHGWQPHGKRKKAVEDEEREFEKVKPAAGVKAQDSTTALREGAKRSSLKNSPNTPSRLLPTENPHTPSQHHSGSLYAGTLSEVPPAFRCCA